MPLEPKSTTRRIHSGLGATLVAAAALWSTIASAGPPYAGRPLDDALRDIGQQGLHLVYSTETVPPSLKVTREPEAGTPLDVLKELLKQHGLEAKQVGADTYAVVRKGTPPAQGLARVAQANPAPLEEVVVAASRYSLSAEYPDAHTFLTHAEIEGMPRLADDSLKAVHRLPGAATNGVSGLAY
ncbi:MAG: STN domain-containing protein, partial [Steroidobacteraceae bacterium]|nr:STN domain-containing protein [Steroidobacteraceae bacterium]